MEMGCTPTVLIKFLHFALKKVISFKKLSGVYDGPFIIYSGSR
jgi:hypothetical protein